MGCITTSERASEREIVTMRGRIFLQMSLHYLFSSMLTVAVGELSERPYDQPIRKLPVPPIYIRNPFLEQILHYNNDFEIDNMCLRNWCALGKQ